MAGQDVKEKEGEGVRCSCLLKATGRREGRDGAAVAFSPDGVFLAVGEVERLRLFYRTVRRKRSRGVWVDGGVLPLWGGLMETELVEWNSIPVLGPREAGWGPERIVDIAFSPFLSPDGGLLAACTSHGRTYLWSFPSRRLRLIIGNPRGATETRGVAFSPDGHLLATVLERLGLQLWSIGGRGVLTYLHNSLGGLSAAFSPDGRLLALGQSEGRIIFWSLEGVEELPALPIRTPEEAFEQRNLLREVASVGGIGPVFGLDFSPDGRLLAAGYGGGGGVAALWRIEDGEGRVEEEARLEGHSSSVRDVAFSPDGELLATCSFDEKILVWSVESKRVVAVLEGERPVYKVAFSPDRRFLAAGCTHGEVRLWRVSPSWRRH